MSSKAANYTKRHYFPIIFGVGLVAAYIAFENRFFFLRSTLEEAKKLYKPDPDFEIMYEKARVENDERKQKL